jgi:3-methyladenine DNA glycosylase AlkC
MLSTRVAALRCIMLLQRAGQQQFQHSSQAVPQFQQLTTAAGQRCMLLLPSSHPEATIQQSSRKIFLQLVPQ